MAPGRLTLATGGEIPMVGLGTFRSRGEDVRRAVGWALAMGIRHIDTASIYKNHADISQALQATDVPREELFLTSKISPYEQGTIKATDACEAALRDLDTDYLDLMLVHWPGAARQSPTSSLNAVLRLETWRVLERFFQEGRFRAIGVSNYEERHLEELLRVAKVPPAVNQFEAHPRCPNESLRIMCQKHGVVATAYGSLGGGHLLHNPVVAAVAKKCQRSSAQVLLRWGLQRGFAVIPKSVHRPYIEECCEGALLSWDLSASHMAELDGLEDGHRYCWDPSDVV